MKVLLVTHRYPPEGRAGTETYTAGLAAALRRRGHATSVYAAFKDIASADLSTREREHEGIPVREIANNLFPTGFRATWDRPEIARDFEAHLQRLAPDLVHFQHLMYLSIGCVEAARRRGLPVVFTLHDFWLQCPRFGQRVHADGGLCDTVDFARCGTCLPSFKFSQSAAERRVGRVVAGVRATTGVDLAPLVRSAADAVRRGAFEYEEPGPEESAAMRAAAQERSSAMRERVVPAVDLFLAPSRFLRGRFTREWGIPEARIEHLRFGVDLEAFGRLPRTQAEKVRVTFVGSLIPVKGAHLLLEAWGRVPANLRARGELALHGPSRHEPAYQRRLEERAREVGARISGELDRDGVARVLASTDLLVVPSLWFENSPLVVLEALAARTPLLVSDQGGMAELVQDGANGWRFHMGDADDLARRLAFVLEDPARLAALRPHPLDLPRVDEHAAAVEARYRVLLAGRAT